MLYEDLRFIHEDLERLEQAVSDRMLDEPKHIRDRLARDHEMSQFLERIKSQSQRALNIYKDTDARTAEIQSISTGDQFDHFYSELNTIKEWHKRYPNQPVDNLERAYKRRAVGDVLPFPSQIDSMFTGEEAFGRFFDMMALHEDYINLPGLKKRITYLQYLDTFDKFDAVPRSEKTKDQYFRYVGALAEYLENFMRRTKPLEHLEKLFASFDAEFEEKWEKDEVPGWSLKGEAKQEPDGPATEGTGEGVWCPDCEKEFKNENTYKAHVTGKKHIKLAAARQARLEGGGEANGVNGLLKTSGQRLKEKAIAEREWRTRKLASTMQTERSDTRANVERKQGMTDKERQQELQALYTESTGVSGPTAEGEEGDDDDEKIYNPLKLPLAWDGKPIPFWLYKLHGLGVEFPCEICGNFVYMGRRAFDKHFSEARHLYGLKCLGITNSTLFREITGIEEAKRLWDKIQGDKKSEQQAGDQVVQMEDQEGNVMPEKVYYDLQKQGLL